MSQAALLLEKYHDRPIPSSAMNQFPALGNKNQTQPLEKGTFLGKKENQTTKAETSMLGCSRPGTAPAKHSSRFQLASTPCITQLI